MLAQIVVLMAALALFATTAVAGVAGYARSQTAAAAKAQMSVAVETVLASYERDIRARIAGELAAAPAAPYSAPLPAIAALNGGDAWPVASGVLPAESGEPLRVAYDIEPTTRSAPACSPQSGAPNGGPDTATNVQCSGFVQESRLSLSIATSAGPLGRDGTVSVLASSRITVTLRLFAQRPYVMVAGVNDAAAVTALHEGDAGGWSGQNNAARPDDATIHVTYACGGDPACATSVPPSQDVTRTLPWSNGNGRPALP